MDKKNFTIGALLLVAAFAVLFFGPRSAPPATARAPASEKTPVETSRPGSAPAALPSPTHPAPPPESAVNAAFAAVSRESAEANVTKLTNGIIEARFTDSGGALLDVAFITRD